MEWIAQLRVLTNAVMAGETVFTKSVVLTILSIKEKDTWGALKIHGIEICRTTFTMNHLQKNASKNAQIVATNLLVFKMVDNASATMITEVKAKETTLNVLSPATICMVPIAEVTGETLFMI